jgi:hypothetical protein
VYQWKLGVSQPLGLWSLVSPSFVPVVAVFLLALSYEVFSFLFAFSFLVFLAEATLAVGGGELSFVVSSAMVLSGRANFEGFFGARSAYLGGFFIDTRSSVVVAGFLWSGCVKPRPWWFFLLGAWPARAKEISPVD